MELKIEIKNRFTGKVLFELSTKNNSVKETLEAAVKENAVLTGAVLTGADLRGAVLRGAYLTGADLRGAVLRGAVLRGADLRGAVLRGAYLTGADLTGADLRGAVLRGADLRGAVLRGADLTGADLTGADLTGADLRGAVLRGAVLRDYKIKVAAVFTGLYTYIVIPYITEENQHRVKMGCHDRSVTDWDSDFWNNDKEFPNDNSVRSNLRLMAYNTAKEWLKIQSDDTTSNPSAEEA